MENIFENAKFADKYLTRDGRKASYVKYGEGPNYEIHHWLAVEGSADTWGYNDDGTQLTDRSMDIVSRYKEPIDEKKLNKVLDDAEELRNSAKGRAETGGWYWRRWAEWGYRKAKDE